MKSIAGEMKEFEARYEQLLKSADAEIQSQLDQFDAMRRLEWANQTQADPANDAGLPGTE